MIDEKNLPIEGGGLQNSVDDVQSNYRNVSDEDSPAIHTTIIEPKGSLGRLGIPEVWENIHLLKFFVLRSLRTRYRPTTLGYGWIIARPFFLCLAYVFVIGFLFHVKSGSTPFPLFVFLGVSVFLFFSSTVTDTAASLFSNASTMSKVYYPRLIIPLNSLVVNFVDFAAAMVIVLLLMMIYKVMPGWQFVLVPFFILGICLAGFSVGLILAALAVKTRDVMMILPVVMRVFIYAMPCVYPVTLVPERLLNLYYLNPMASYLQGLRWALLGEIAPPVWSLIFASTVVPIALFYGLYLFNSKERTLVDSL